MVTLASTLQALQETTVKGSPAQRARAEETGGSAQAATEDSTAFSPEAQQAAAMARLAEDIRESEIRQAKVEEAKRRIQEGTYKLVEIVNVVAERISGIATA